MTGTGAGTFKLVCKGVIEALAPLPENVFHGCLCDPPYGLSKNGSAGGFMGKRWDARVPGPEYWAAILRVLKPGAVILAFGGTRTYHRLACAIEDAGFEISDSILGSVWMYGQGFPKSLDIGKAIDKAAGAEREKTGTRTYGDGHIQRSSPDKLAPPIGTFKRTQDLRATSAPATDHARTWNGYGTALKPAWESVIGAAKPHTLSSICGILAHKIQETICQLPSFAKAAGLDSRSSHLVYGADGPGSALWSAVEQCSTPAALSALTDTLPSGSEIPSSLSIALSWLGILGALSYHESMFTTETVSSLTTDLKILNSSPSPITPACIIAASTNQLGTSRSAYLAASVLAAARARLDFTLTHSAQDPATSQDEFLDSLRSAWEPVVCARKPRSGTYAENCIEHGCGGLNIDGSKIAGSKPDTTRGAGGKHGRYGPLGAQGRIEDDGKGRYPANLILSHHPDCSPLGTRRVPPRGGDIKPNSKGAGPRSNQVYGADPADRGEWTAYKGEDGLEEVESWECHPECPVGRLDQQSGASSSHKGTPRKGKSGNGWGMTHTGAEYEDRGGASRFFYQAKVSTRERNAGLDASSPNRHATLKPLALTTYLARLILPPTPSSRLLVPFCGTGSEVAGALLAGWSHVVGIDDDPESITCAQDRIPGLLAQGAPLK